MIARLRPDGGLDRTFGDSGATTVTRGVATDSVFTPDGGVLIWDRQRIQRFDANGRPDRNFGSGGVVELSDPAIQLKNEFIPLELEVAADGHVFLSGELRDGSGRAVQALKADGTADPSFNGGQAVVPALDQSAGQLYAMDIATGPGGSLFVSLAYYQAEDFGSTTRVGVLKLNSSGTGDPAFGQDGSAWFPVRQDFPPSSLTSFVAADGTLSFIAFIPTPGLYLDPGSFQGTIRPDGTAPRYFGFQVPGKRLAASDASFGPDGSAGLRVFPVYERFEEHKADWAESQSGVRLGPDGLVSPDFGDGGFVATRIGRSAATVDAAPTADGGLVLGGLATADSCRTDRGKHPCNVVMALSRYGSDGKLDPDFGRGGVVTFPQMVCRDVDTKLPFAACPEAILPRPAISAKFQRSRVVIRLRARKGALGKEDWRRASVRFSGPLRLKAGGKSAIRIAGDLAVREPGGSEIQPAAKAAKVKAPDLIYRRHRLSVVRYGSFRSNHLRIVIPRRVIRLPRTAARPRKVRVSAVFAAPSLGATSARGWLRLPRR